MRRFVFCCEQWLPQSLAEVFPFFAAARNLEAITPPWLRFEVLTPAPVEMRVGALVERLFVRRDVEAIFAFRRAALEQRFTAATATPAVRPG